MILPPPSRVRGSRLGQVAPLPLVGIATILVALIVFTPVLFASGPSPLSVSPELVVYRAGGTLSTEFYLRSVGDVAYSSIDLELGTFSPANWTGACPATGISWSYDNQSNRLEVNATTTSTVMVVDAEATYSQSGSMTIYAGDFAFQLLYRGASDEGLTVVTCPSTPGLSAPSSILTSDMPVGLYLANFGSAGPP